MTLSLSGAIFIQEWILQKFENVVFVLLELAFESTAMDLVDYSFAHHSRNNVAVPRRSVRN